MNKIRKGDEVVVITGKDKGRRGTVLQVFDDQRVLVEYPGRHHRSRDAIGHFERHGFQPEDEDRRSRWNPS
jgi:ribosomal protein L24